MKRTVKSIAKKVFYPSYERYIECKKRRVAFKRLNKNRNRNFTIIANNCCGSTIYKRLGVRFNSPTIGLFMSNKDFLLFSCYLEQYLNGVLIESKNNGQNYPVGIINPFDSELPSINVNFVHYSSFEEANNSWERRKKRINWSDIYVLFDICNNADDTTENDATMFNKISQLYPSICLYKKTNNEVMNDIRNKVMIRFPKKYYNSMILSYSFLGNLYLDQFDYVGWLNDKYL